MMESEAGPSVTESDNVFNATNNDCGLHISAISVLFFLTKNEGSVLLSSASSDSVTIVISDWISGPAHTHRIHFNALLF